MILPSDQKKLAAWASEIISRCRANVGPRASAARTQKTWLYTGSPDGSGSIINLLYQHIDRLGSYLFSPNDLRFHIDFTHSYPKQIMAQAEVAGRVITREFERRDIDIQFGAGVPIALTYGSCFPKLIDADGGITCKLCMPWHIGVYRPDRNDLSEQEAICETNFITPFDLWRRISHLPDALSLFRKCMQYSTNRSAGNDQMTLNSVVIAGSSPAVVTEPPFLTQPGGLVNVTADWGGVHLAPQVQDELITFHELWVWDDETGDWTTIQFVEPDIIIAPRYRRKNLFVPGEIPYGIIQPNFMPQDFFGRSELIDLMKLQHLLKDRMEDVKKIMSLQYDRRLAFMGSEQISAEQYDDYLQAGFINVGAGGDVKDITPELPEEAFGDINEIVKMFERIAGFDNILSGQGEPGVRAGNHAQTLMKTAAPRLRDRALLVERQCADFAHKLFECMVAKQANAYWTDDSGQEGEFLLSQLPDDYRVMVDSHSSSPIYQEDHVQTAFALAKLEAIGAEDLIDLLPLPRRDLLKLHAREMAKEKAALIQQHPELLERGKKK